MTHIHQNTKKNRKNMPQFVLDHRNSTSVANVPQNE